MSENTSAERKSNSLKGLRIKTISFWMVGVTLIVAFLIGDGIINVMNRHQRLVDMTNEYILAQNDARDMMVGSDYLTEQVRLYAITKDTGHVDNYFTEVEETRRRDLALQGMEKHLEGKDDKALQMTEEALRLSNELMELEMHSMKLAALSAGEDVNSLPKRVQEYPLSEEEATYTSQEQSDAAAELVFGQEYRDMKQQIEEKLSNVTKSVITVCERDQAESEHAMKNALIRQSIYTVLVVVLIILSYIMIAVLILRPIKIYVNCIQNNNLLEITGAYEFKYLAATYNNVYEMSQEQQDMLRQKAERDALTGLLNRQAFEHLKEKLKEATKPVTFMLLDVDVFKAINDNYGHEMGDQALIKVANLLEENFRKDDYVIRIGGDEFAVIMEKAGSDEKETISSKIEKINEILQNPQDDFPKYSLSVGVAFSEQGYKDELFRQADEALYCTKKNGRCGYTFYEL